MTEIVSDEYLKLKKICRGCLEAVEHIYFTFFENQTEQQNTIINKFTSCTSLNIVREDGLPDILCKKCTEQLESAYTFRTRCINSNTILRDFYRPSKEENNSPLRNERQVQNEIETNAINDNFETKTVKYSNITNNVEKLQKNSNEIDKNSLFSNIKNCDKISPKVAKKYCCTECSKCFKSLITFKHHKKIHEPKIGESKCEEKDIDDTKNCINKIKDSSMCNPKFTCNICNKSYVKASNLTAHMGLHSGIQPYKCTICDKKFTQGRAYACHMRTHSNKSKKNLTCSKCYIAFNSENDLKAHRDDISSPCYVTVTNQIKNTNSVQYVCSVCGRNYCNSGNLKAHMRLHSGERPYSCNICGKKFAQSNAHSYHMKVHLGERPFACDLCLKAFTTNGQLVNHRRLHTHEKPYACSLCPKKFTQKITYNIHMMSHTGNKPHLCSVCGKKYSQNSQLMEHMRIHNGEKYKCKQCGKTYSTSGNLAAHMRTHTGIKPHSCTICGKSFYVANKLAKHMRSHGNERSFSCPVCSKYFTSSGVLTMHLRSHIGEHSYICSVCDKGFANDAQMSVHLKTHTNEFVSSENLRTCISTINSNLYDMTSDNFSDSKRLLTL